MTADTPDQIITAGTTGHLTAAALAARRIAPEPK